MNDQPHAILSSSPPSSTVARPWRLAAYLGLFAVVALTLFIGRKHGYTVDANASFAITQAIVSQFNLFPETAVKQGYVYSILYIPFFLLGAALHSLFPAMPAEFWQRKCLCWMNTAAVGCTVAYLSLTLQTLGYRKSTQAAVALIYGFSMLAFSYARYDYNKCVAALFLSASFYYFLHFIHTKREASLLWCGASMGLLLMLRLEMGITLGVYAAALFFHLQCQNNPTWPRTLGLLLAPASFGAAFVALYNLAYWSGSASGGYEGSFGLNPFPALYGFFFSPGKSLFLFNPALLLLPLCIRAFYQRNHAAFWLWSAACLPLILLYSFWGNWWGGWGYGPRHLVPVLPLLALPLAEWMERQGRASILIMCGLFCAGFFVQFIGAAIAFHDVINHLMQNGVTETELIWNPAANPALQHLRFAQAIPVAQWDFGWIAVYAASPAIALVWLAASLASLAGLGWLIRIEMTHEAK